MWNSDDDERIPFRISQRGRAALAAEDPETTVDMTGPVDPAEDDRLDPEIVIGLVTDTIRAQVSKIVDLNERMRQLDDWQSWATDLAHRHGFCRVDEWPDDASFRARVARALDGFAREAAARGEFVDALALVEDGPSGPISAAALGPHVEVIDGSMAPLPFIAFPIGPSTDLPHDTPQDLAE